MATLTLNNRGFRAMAAEGDSGWVSLFGVGTSIATFVLGGFGALVLRGMTWASAEGRAEGEFRVWKAKIEEQYNSINVQISAVEARLAARMLMLEARKDRIDDQLRVVPTRDEMNEGFDRIERQITRMADFIHQNAPRDRRGVD